MHLHPRSAALAFALALAPLSCALADARPANDAQQVASRGAALADPIDDRIARGRAKLEAGDAREAQKLFDEAADIEGASPRTRVWVVRGWIAQGRVDDALQTADELKTQGAASLDVDYLLGLAFFAKAKQAIESGTSDAYTQSELEDAALMLRRASSNDGERFHDAFVPLAEAAWYSQDLQVARTAIERARAMRPEDPQVHLLLGRIALSQYVEARESEPQRAELDRKVALDGFARSVSLLAKPRGPDARRALADAYVQLGHAHAWNPEETDAARKAYVTAMAWDPAAVDFNRALETLGQESFVKELARARTEFAKHHSAKDPGAAVLAWWEGYAHFRNSEWSEAERAFLGALEANPGFTNSWYYLFRVRFGQQEFRESLAALRAHAKDDLGGLVGSLAADQELDVPILRFLEAWCAEPARNAGAASLADAAFVSDLLTRVQPEEPQFWNNLGLFLRDAGEALPETEAEQADEFYEHAYVAYSRALELAPENPAYLNDTAVMLHYYLDRDLERAKELYEKASRRAEEELAREDLDPDLREWMRTARRDSRDNLRKLDELMRKRAESGARAGN